MMIMMNITFQRSSLEITGMLDVLEVKPEKPYCRDLAETEVTGALLD